MCNTAWSCSPTHTPTKPHTASLELPNNTSMLFYCTYAGKAGAQVTLRVVRTCLVALELSTGTHASRHASLHRQRTRSQNLFSAAFPALLIDTAAYNRPCCCGVQSRRRQTMAYTRPGHRHRPQNKLTALFMLFAAKLRLRQRGGSAPGYGNKRT
jgi:hypothetical protein